MAVSTVEPKFSGLFTTVTYTLVNSETVAASGFVNKSQTITKTGYYPVSALSWSSNTSWLTVSRLNLSGQTSGSGTLTLNMRSFRDKETTGVTVYVYVLWMKE